MSKAVERYKNGRVKTPTEKEAKAAHKMSLDAIDTIEKADKSVLMFRGIRLRK